MPALKLNCAFVPNSGTVSKKNLSQSREQQLRKRVKQTTSKWVLTNPNRGTLEAAEKAAAQKLMAHRLIDLQDFTGSKVNKLTAWIAEWLGQYTGKEGRLAQNLFENKRRAGNLVKLIGHSAGFDTVKPLNKRFKELAKQKGVDKRLHGKLMADLFEVGSTTVDLNLTGAPDGIRSLLEQRNAKFVQDMLDAGFDSTDVDELSRLALKAGTAFESIRSFVEELGYTIPKIENIGYFPRIVTKDAEDYFRVKKYFQAQETSYGSVGATSASDFAKQRASYWYTVEDNKALADMLLLSQDEMDELLLDTSALKSRIEEMVTDDALELLVDSGIMGKVPMTSSELAEWLTTRFEMPFTQFDDMFVTDPHRVLDGYASELREVAGNFGVTKALKEQGFAKGIVSQVARDADDVDVSTLRSAPLFREADIEGYINKDVARLVETVMDIERSPQALSAMSQGWRQLTGVLKTQLLTSPQYVSRIFFGNFMQYALHGGTAHDLVTGIYDILKYQTRGLKAFDDTLPYRVVNGQTYTARQFMLEFAGARIGEVGTALSGAKRGVGGDWSAVNPLLIPKKLGLMAHIAKESENGVGSFLGEAFNQYKKASSTLFSPFGYATHFLDIAFKFSLLKSVTKTGTAWDSLKQGMRLVTSGDSTMYDNFDEALDHIDRAYYTFDDIGRAPNAISAHIIPFFSFTAQSTSALVRDALRSPGKYLTYARVGSLIYDKVQESEDSPIDASLPPWLREDLPITVSKDENGNYITLTVSNVHPLFGSIKEVNKYASMVGLRFIGDYEKERNEAIRELGGGRDPQAILSEFFNDTYAGNAVNTFFNKRRSKTDASNPNTFWGVEMPAGMEAIISYFAPISAYVNNQNPGNVFGSKEVYSGNEAERALGKGQMVREAKPGFLGNGRSDYDNVNAVERANPALGIGARLGLGFTYVEGQKNIQKGYSGIKSDLDQLKRMYQDYARAIATNGKERDRQRLQEVGELMVNVNRAKLALENYMAKNGITPVELDAKLKDRRLVLETVIKQGQQQP